MSRKASRNAPDVKKDIESIIREAQSQPGLVEIMALAQQSQELETLVREQRAAEDAITVVSATTTG